MSATVRPKKVWLCCGFTFSMIAASCFSGIISPAMASEWTYLTSEIITNKVFYLDTPRRWDTPYYAYQTPYAGTPGGTLIIGQRDTEWRQFSRAEARNNERVQFHNDDGTDVMPPGEFFINVKSTGACGGDGCGEFGFESYFLWGV